jgi:acetylornithine/succinyldiaminopimelate/putrescine aminotransferase
MTALRDRAGRLPIKEVRGRGLFIGVEFEEGYQRTAADVVGEALDRGFLLGSAGDRVLRIAPPIIVSESELERGVELVADLLSS